MLCPRPADREAPAAESGLQAWSRCRWAYLDFPSAQRATLSRKVGPGLCRANRFDRAQLRACSGCLSRSLDDLGLPRAAGDLDLARLGFFGHWDVHRQHTVVEAGLDVICVKALTEEQLPGEGPMRPLGGQDVGRPLGLPGSLGRNREHVLLHGELD